MNEVKQQRSTYSIAGDSRRIMLVDDKPDNLRTLKAVLETHGYKTFAAINGELALAALSEVQPELILLDIQMPNMDGYEVCQRLKAEPHTQDIPVLFLSALHDPMDKVKGFEVGGVDYISKPFQSEELLARVKTHLNLYHLQQDLERARDDLEDRVNARTAELVDANKALSVSENRFKTLVSNIPGVTYRCDLDKYWTKNFISDGIFKLSGYPADEFVDNRIRSFISIVFPDDLKMVDETVTSAINQQQPYTIEYRTIHASGDVRWVYERGQAIFDEKKNLISLDGAIFDITDRKLAEEALRKAEEEASQQRERLARLARIQVAGEMATSFAHELNQPLAAIESYALASLQRLETDADNIAKLKELLDKIRKQANRAGHVIEHLRAMVKKHETRNVIVDVNDLLNETVALAEIEIALCGCRVKIISEHELPTIEADKIQIQQVILNLIRNAIDAVCDLKEEEKKLLLIQSNMNEKNEVEISVTDNGNGVPDSEIGKLFEPFYTTKETGMGIGLSICRTIIEAHGGKIGYSSNPDGGAIFHFSLPRKSGKV